ncbi:MAG TPA: Gfo/Idh/MocA family oxidoreductase [Anaerolineales bacterium]|nr:Gfo/Idh/MocA family oxidoreductase [Anaerolineales bacterium]
MRKLKWGVLSTSRIGMEAVVPALQMCRNGQVVAIASREQVRAEAAAAKLGIATAHGSYEALLADPQVEAVYNPLPNHLHVPWSIRALEAGKHVLCEKPIALNAAEAAQLIEAARLRRELKVMEAFMYRFHPQWATVRELLGAGAIGHLTTIYSTFTYHNLDPQDYRNVPEYGGGGLLDIGCYSISSSRWLFDAEPRRVFGIVDYDPTFKIDRLASAILDFGVGTATFTCATQIPRHQREDVCGTLGRIVIEAPFTPPFDAPARVWLHTADETRQLVSPAANQYQRMGEAFADAVFSGAEVPTPLEDAYANMKVIDAVFQSGELGRWVSL